MVIGGHMVAQRVRNVCNVSMCLMNEKDRKHLRLMVEIIQADWFARSRPTSSVSRLNPFTKLSGETNKKQAMAHEDGGKGNL